MELIRINEAVENFGVSSRTLRYYEEAGLLWSAHPDNKTQRYYDAAALERLKQIIVLRKFQIPVKDIAKLFESENTAELIKVFVNKLESLDTEISALSQLRKLVDEFLHKMLMSGIKKISAITLLYEETEKRLALAENAEEITFEKLSRVSRKTLRLHDVRLIRLPAMRVLTSRYKTGESVNFGEIPMQSVFSAYSFTPNPGMREAFMRKEAADEWIMLMKIPDDFNNYTVFTDETLPGGLYAVSSAFFENMDDTFVLLREWVNNSGDFTPDNSRAEMLEEIMPWDIAENFKRYQQDIFIPVSLKQFTKKETNKYDRK
ncbi:MAG: MerR family transcriptional regulator [Clostridiales bacterium]|nr:MerR family transcriptional regulator [Clostridiales bacterium]